MTITHHSGTMKYDYGHNERKRDFRETTDEGHSYC